MASSLSFSSFSFENLSLETIVVILFIFLLVVASLRYGKSFLVTYILALYPAYVILISLPYAQTSNDVINFVITLVVYLLVFFGIRNMIHSHFTYGWMQYLQAIVLSIVAAALTLVVYLALSQSGVKISSFLLSTAHYVSNLIPMFAVWLALPLVVVFFLGRE